MPQLSELRGVNTPSFAFTALSPSFGGEDPEGKTSSFLFTRRRTLRWIFLITSLLCSSALFLFSLWDYTTAHKMRNIMARAQGLMLIHGVHEKLRRGPPPPRRETLTEILDAQRFMGLLGVTIGRPGRPILSAGQALAGLGSCVIPDDTVPPGEKLTFGQGGARLWVRTGPPPDGHHRPPVPDVIVDFSDFLSEALLARGRRNLWASLIVSVLLLGSSGFLFWLARQAEATEHRSQRQRQLASLGEMSAVMAHEIRNPLASLKGHAQLLLEQVGLLGTEDGARLGKKVARIVGEAERLEDLTKSLLDFARAGRIERRPVAPAALLSAACADLPQGRIDLDLSRAPSRWSLDPVRMQQVLTNLLINAIQSSPEANQGVMVEASVYPEGRTLVFLIRDRGPGLPAGDEERIFEAFFTTRVHGTGLGLALSRRIVEGHGGRIEAANHPEGGAVFTIHIPAN